MLVRRDEFRASKIMAERVKNTENIEILYNTETDEVLGDGQVVTGVRVFNNQTNEKHEIPATGFFVAIGHKPNTDIFKDYLDLDETGYIINAKPGTSKKFAITRSTFQAGRLSPAGVAAPANDCH